MVSVAHHTTNTAVDSEASRIGGSQDVMVLS